MSGGLETAASKGGWRPSLGRMMLGVAIAALYFTEDTRIALVVLTYLLYPIALGWLVISRRWRRVTHDRPGARRLAWIALAGVAAGWPCLLLVPTIPHADPLMRPLVRVAMGFVLAPVVLVSLAAWLLVPLPRMERRRP